MVRLRARGRGVEEIVALHRPIHATIYRDSTLENVALTDPRTGAIVLRR